VTAVEDASDEPRLEYQSDDRHGHGGEDHAHPEVPHRAVHGHYRRVRPDHEEDPVREVQHVEHPEDEAESDRDQEQPAPDAEPGDDLIDDEAC